MISLEYSNHYNTSSIELLITFDINQNTEIVILLLFTI